MLQINEAVGNVQLMQKINRLKVLNFIRQSGETARPQIARSTGLSPSSVTNIVTYLIDKKLVVEKGPMDSKEVGRKATLIRFNPLAGNIISVNIELNEANIAFTDLEGNILTSKSLDLYKNDKETEILKKIEKGIEQIIEDVNTKRISSNLLGIGIAVSGLVIDDERLEISASLGWKGLPLREYFEERFNLPVYVQNNSKTKALAVLKQNLTSSNENIVFLDLAMGVGIINFYGNEINEAVIGEIGHTTVKKDGPKCFCGNNGCLEVMCSVDAVISRCKELLTKDNCPKLKELLEKKNIKTINDEDDNKLKLYDIILEAFDAGDKDVEKVLTECGEYLGIGIANIINLFNPNRIIIDGDILLRSDFIYKKALEQAKLRAYEQFVMNMEFNKVHINSQTAIKGISLFVTGKVLDIMGPEI